MSVFFISFIPSAPDPSPRPYWALFSNERGPEMKEPTSGVWRILEITTTGDQEVTGGESGTRGGAAAVDKRRERGSSSPVTHTHTTVSQDITVLGKVFSKHHLSSRIF